MLRGWVSILATPLADLTGAATMILDRAATVTFLRLATLALAQGLDLATFTLMVQRHGVAAEANPIVTGLLLNHGMTAIVVAKLALIVCIGGLSVAALSRERGGVWRFVGGLPLAFAIAAGIIGGITNTAALLHP